MNALQLDNIFWQNFRLFLNFGKYIIASEKKILYMSGVDSELEVQHPGDFLMEAF
jgi:hypothetical protein